MSANYTFLQLIKEVLENTKMPMSPSEIWEKALELKLDTKLNSKGQTPWQTIGARLYMDAKEQESIFIQVSKRPIQFALKKYNTFSQKENLETTTKELVKQKQPFNERDLHSLLVNFVYSHDHFKSYCKTIFHESSQRRIKGMNEWIHPDIVGVYYPYKDLNKEVNALQASLNVNSVKLFSFELKIRLDFQNLRESFFQAVSNSSWANEGYLVCLKLEKDIDFINELQRLSNSFGIGVILLNGADLYSSEITFPSRFKEYIDWETVNRLAEDSSDFKEFLTYVVDDIQVGKQRGDFDKILSEEDMQTYIQTKHIV